MSRFWCLQYWKVNQRSVAILESWVDEHSRVIRRILQGINHCSSCEENKKERCVIISVFVVWQDTVDLVIRSNFSWPADDQERDERWLLANGARCFWTRTPWNKLVVHEGKLKLKKLLTTLLLLYRLIKHCITSIFLLKEQLIKTHNRTAFQ